MKNKIYSAYLLNVFASGIFYSFTTSALLDYNINNSLIVIILSALVELLIVQDILITGFVFKINYKIISVLSFIISIIVAVAAKLLPSSLVVLLSSYFVVSLMLSLISLFLQERILKYETDLKFGFFNIQQLRNISKMLGFFVGILFKYISIDNLYLYIFIFITLVNVLIGGDDILSAPKSNKKVIREKWLYILMGIYSVVTVIFIPLVTKSFIDNNLDKISWLPFIFPGIASILLIEIQKKRATLFDSLFMEIIYFPMFIMFFLLRIYGLYPILQAVILSVIVALSISISIKIRKRFFKVNKETDAKYLIQTLTFIGSVFSLIISSFGVYKEKMEWFVFFMALTATAYVILKRRSFK
ncbi:TPA: hypothetical protein VBN90_000272 [Streptococcus agalactiae]|nr:hypothetical protein [Streptococcus agalactiae]